MRKYKKDNILQLINTMLEVHGEIKVQLCDEKYEVAKDLIVQCQEAAISIGNLIEEEEQNIQGVISLIIDYCDKLNIYYNCIDKNELDVVNDSELNIKLVDIKEKIYNEIVIELEVVFLAYKASMWDSLESIWIVANEDVRCKCYVIPIPYYDKNPDGTLKEAYYEADKFPEYVPITSYKEYDMASHRPDIIYFHNPYDGGNYITTVHPNYYSEELKKYTEMLVYVPYFIAGNEFDDFDEAKRILYHISSGVINSTYVIAQSEVWAKAVSASGIPLSKFLVLGSPKIDAVISSVEKEYCVPKEWSSKIGDKKRFLINTSIATTLSRKDIFSMMRRIIVKILADEYCSIIWRPHPLLRSTLVSMRPNMVSEFDDLVKYVNSQKHAIVDETSDMYVAFSYSDALISDTSSILKLYILTGKPVLDLIVKDEPKKYLTLDWYGVYHYFDGMFIDDFMQLVLDGDDYKKVERISRLVNSIANADGTCGKKVHEEIINRLEG